MKIPGAGKVELVYTAEDGSETRELVHNLPVQVLYRECTISMILSQVLPGAVLVMRWTLIRISGLRQKIQFPKKYDHTF